MRRPGLPYSPPPPNIFVPLKYTCIPRAFFFIHSKRTLPPSTRRSISALSSRSSLSRISFPSFFLLTFHRQLQHRRRSFRLKPELLDYQDACKTNAPSLPRPPRSVLPLSIYRAITDILAGETEWSLNGRHVGLLWFTCTYHIFM